MSILIAICDKSNAEKVLRFAAPIISGIGEPVVLLTIIGHGLDSTLPEATEILTESCQSLQIPEIHTKTRTGNPYTEILHESEAGNYNLVIVGEWPSRRLRHGHLASSPVCVAERIPTLTILVKQEARLVRNVLICDSGSEISPTINHFADVLDDLLAGDGDITIFHVMSQISAAPGIRGIQLRVGADQLIKESSPEGQILKRDIRKLERPGVRLHTKVAHGLVVDEVVSESHRGDYDLVVIGGHILNGIQSFLLDDLAHKILAQVKQPILIIR